MARGACGVLVNIRLIQFQLRKEIEEKIGFDLVVKLA